MRRINMDHGCNGDCGGGCEDCAGGNARSYFEGLEQKPNIEQLVPIPGPSGKNSLLNGSITDGTTDSNGTDDAIGGSTVADLLAMGFNIAAKPTLVAKIDSSDGVNTKYWIRDSNAFLNFFSTLKNKLLSAGSALGQIPIWDGAAWVPTTPTYEQYNSVTTTSIAFNSTMTGLIGTTLQFTVGTGYAYRFKHVLAVVDPANSNNYLEGVVTDYSAGKVTILIKNISGAGNTSDWKIMLTAPEYLPYPTDPANFGKYLYNNNGVLEMRTSVESIGYVKISVVPSSIEGPDQGWLDFDGVTRTQAEFPALYAFLNYTGSTFISGTNFTLPNMANRTIGGVDSGDAGFDAIGELIGDSTKVLLGDNLPEVSPYPVTSVVTGSATHGLIPAGATRNSGLEANFVYDVGAYGAITIASTVDPNTGSGGTPVDVRQKTMAVRFIIKAV